MATTNPTTDEDEIALSDGGMQQLIAHAQAQQAQAQLAQAQHDALAAQHAAAVADDVVALAAADVHMASAGLSKVDSGEIDFMPLSAAPVGLGSPSAVPGAAGITGDGGVVGLDTPTGAGTNANNLAIKRKSIPLSMKKEAIEWILGPGKGIPSRAEKHFSALNWDVSASSFRKWWKNREKILGDSSHKKRITGGGRKPYLEHAEEKLLVVVIQERAKKDRVTRKWIAKTAQHMFQRTNVNFKASENWVTKFIRRNGLTLKRSYVTYEQQQQQPMASSVSHEHVGDDGEAQPEGHIEIDDDDEDMSGTAVMEEQELDGREDQDADAVLMDADHHEERKTYVNGHFCGFHY